MAATRRTFALELGVMIRRSARAVPPGFSGDWRPGPLAGSLPTPGVAVKRSGRRCGWVGGFANHLELGGGLSGDGGDVEPVPEETCKDGYLGHLWEVSDKEVTVGGVGAHTN